MESDRDVFQEVAGEIIHQLELADKGQFRFTAGTTGLRSAERLFILSDQVGKVAAEAMADPSSGMMPVTHAGTFDFHRAGWAETGYPGTAHPKAPTGTQSGLRNRLLATAAVALAWVGALDSAGDAPPAPWKPQSAESESANAEAPPFAA